VTEKIGVSDSEDSSSDESDESSMPSIENDNTELISSQIFTIEKTHSELMDCSVVMLHMTEPPRNIIQMSQPHIVEIVDDDKPIEHHETISLSDLDNIEQIDSLSTSSSLSSNNDIESIVETFDFKKMKITQLKEIAASKGLDTKGIKKNELIESLSKSKK
jgi:hypothetical protein